MTDEVDEMSAASRGSRPVAWMVEWTDHIDLFRSRSCAEYVASGGVKVQPLYRHPTLTEAEREAIAEAMRQVVESDCIATPHALEVIDTLRGLLERLG